MLKKVYENTFVCMKAQNVCISLHLIRSQIKNRIYIPEIDVTLIESLLATDTLHSWIMFEIESNLKRKKKTPKNIWNAKQNLECKKKV